MPLRARRRPLRGEARPIRRSVRPVVRKRELVLPPRSLDGALDLASEFDRPVASRGVFVGYQRILTPEGGILILYKDQLLALWLTILRVANCMVATAVGGWWIFCVSSLSGLHAFVAFVLLMVLNVFVATRKIAVSHSVEIRPDAMIIDAKDVFYAEDIGDQWPALQPKDDDPERLVICGICGTRFIEYMTANRMDENDRTPEVLAGDLKAAMEQLWGRREVTFAPGF